MYIIPFDYTFNKFKSFNFKAQIKQAESEMIEKVICLIRGKYEPPGNDSWQQNIDWFLTLYLL
jgi:hypothetical protein